MACGCEPSAQRPVVGSGPVPSLQTSCCSGTGAVVGCFGVVVVGCFGVVVVGCFGVVVVGCFGVVVVGCFGVVVVGCFGVVVVGCFGVVVVGCFGVVVVGCPDGKDEVCEGEVVTCLQIAPQVIGPTMPSTCNALFR